MGWSVSPEHGTAGRNDGERLRFSDETLRYRCALRAEHLQRRMNGAGYNPITGAPMDRVYVPDAPRPPSFLQAPAGA